MSERADLPEPDVLPGTAHPRLTETLFGQGRAEASFLQAFNADRLHHAWLLTGSQGVGKSTLAWRIARFLLATPPADGGLFGAPPAVETLDIAADHPVAHRIRALSEPGLFLLRRGPNDKGDRLATDITVGEVRKLVGFFGLSAADGGRRVVIVDAMDEMNVSAANALLKMLEEPPARTTMLLISHQPARLLPTIRSRCRTLALDPLSPDDLTRALDKAGHLPQPGTEAALAELAAGSVGAAVQLARHDGLALYGDLVRILSQMPTVDRARLLSLSESCSGKANEPRLDLTLTLFDALCARIARAGVVGAPPVEIVDGEAQILSRLCPDQTHARRWATTAQSAAERARHARGVNIDAASLVTDMILHLSRAA